MPNKFYLKGIRKERKIVNQARKEGKISFRSAGSHSPIDVAIIDIQSRKIRFIQCKPDNISDNQRKKLLDEFKYLINAAFLVSFEVL